MLYHFHDVFLHHCEIFLHHCEFFLSGKPDVIALSNAPYESVQILATCHSLVQLDDGIVGDPLEKATLKAVGWILTRCMYKFVSSDISNDMSEILTHCIFLLLYVDDSIIPVKRGKSTVMKILQRHHFSSALKRMCVVVAYDLPGSEMHYMVAVKGAPETLKTMVS